MKNISFILLFLLVMASAGPLFAQSCPNSYSKSPVQMALYDLNGNQVTDVVSPGQVYVMKIKPIAAVMSQYPSKSAVNIGVQASSYTSATAGFTLYSGGDSNTQQPFSDSTVQSGVGPDVGSDQTAVFRIKINSDNYDGQISFNGGYYMCVNYYDSNNLPVYKIMPVKLLVAP